MINPYQDIDITCNNCGDTDISNRIFSVYLQIPENISPEYKQWLIYPDILLLIQHYISREIINVGSGTGASLEKVIEIIEEETNSKIEITREDSNVPIVDSIVLDIHKLETLTGYKPTVSLEEGIKYEIMRIKEEI